jgi:O-antigen/teichoic acid export membrane protein
MDEPRMTGLLRLFALDIPFFCLAQSHRQILIGLGQYTQRAGATAVRWLARMVFIVALVELGFGVPGAIVGNIGATLLEFIIERVYVRPPLFRGTSIHLGQLWEYSVPLFLAAVSLRFYDRLDLFALKVLGGTAEQAGMYGAAQRLATIPSFLGLTLAPLLMSTITRMLRDGKTGRAGEIGSYAVRGVLWLLPLGALTAGSSAEIVVFVFGPNYQGAAPLLDRLVFAVLALLLISVTIAVLTAHGKPRHILMLAGPLMPLAILGHYLLIPRLGPAGAALVTLLVASLGALMSLAAMRWLAGVSLPVGTLLRGAAASALVYTLAVLWPAPGLLLLIKLPAIALAAALTLALLGEFTSAEYGLVWSFARRPLRLIFRNKSREA